MLKSTRPAIVAAIAGLLALPLAQPAFAADLTCNDRAGYEGAPLQAPLDLTDMPAGRAISNQAMPEAETERLNETFDRLFENMDVSAATVSIWKPGTGYWTRTKGVTDAGSDSFWWASTGKMATATVILQLIDEGKLAPDARVSSFFPDFRRASTSTVDDLLHHTSGIFTFNADRKHNTRSGYKSPETLIAMADKHPLDFCPGTNWNYSNTGYVMLAQIAEQIEGETFAAIINRRIAAPLGLETFRLLTADDPETAMVPLANEDADGVAEIASIFGAGGIVANSTDMLSFLHAYLESGLIPSSARDKAVTTLYPMFGSPMHYGTGIMVTDVPDKEVPTVWIGHSGGSPDAKALLLYDLKRDAYVAIALNNQAPAEGIANTLLKLLD